MKNLLLLLLSLSCACSSVPSKESLKNKNASLNLPVEIVITGLPKKSPASSLVISPDKQNLQISGAIGLSYSSKKHHHFPLFCPTSTSTAQYDSYGSFEELAQEISFALEDYLKPPAISSSQEFIPDNSSNKISLLIDVNYSYITSKKPDKTFAISLAAAENNTAGAVRSEWGNRQKCYANIQLHLRIISPNNTSKLKKISAEGDRVSIDSTKSVPIAYRSAAEKIARIISLEIIKFSNP
ncbi:MAG: hypothetical protein ACRC37_01255 [Lentisphaeria bacterium]